MTPADRIIADAVAAVIGARLQTVLNGLPGVDPATAAVIAAQAAKGAVRDLRRDGWHITALPPAHHTPEEHR